MCHSLVMIIPDPGECTQGTENEGDVCDCSNDENQVRVDFMVPDIVHDLEKEPANTR
jgi:hypothetical protein